MYENYTYEQIKELPDDQKVKALKELKAIYSENKELAQHLNVATIAISNMVAKYIEGKHVGRKKLTEEEKLQKLEADNLKQQVQNENTKESDIKEEGKYEKSENKQEINTKIEYDTEKSECNKQDIFTIKFEKNITGEEAITRLSGISNLLLKDKKYNVKLYIEEV